MNRFRRLFKKNLNFAIKKGKIGRPSTIIDNIYSQDMEKIILESLEKENSKIFLLKSILISNNKTPIIEQKYMDNFACEESENYFYEYKKHI
tara:strand:+ start:668 stop:943 length:276 start_codon:yes stop_codon:yes gene_type:complete